MKKFILSAAILATLASCNYNNTIATNYEAIQFGNNFVENAVRADYSTTHITEFNVYGTVDGGQGDVLIFDEARVYSNNQDGSQYNQIWNCDVTQYWISGAKYVFTALVDVPENDVTRVNGKLPASFTYTAISQNDVLAHTVGMVGKEAGNNSTVAFTFTHLLAKAYFTLTSGTPDANYTYSISNVKLTNAYANGVYTLPTYAWTDATFNKVTEGAWAGSIPSDYEFVAIENVANGTPKKNAEVLLIPGATVGVSFDVTLKIDGTEITTYNFSKANVATLAANTVYNFNVLLQSQDQINFTVTEQPKWATPDNTVDL